MGLLSKLFGNSEAGDAAKDLLKEVGKAAKALGEELEKSAKTIQNKAEEVQGKTNPFEPSAHAPENSSAKTAPVQTGSRTAGSHTPAGVSWGEEMPEEENQFSYDGTFVEYFEQIFRTEFPCYQVTRKTEQDGKTVIFTFRKGVREALVVELLSQRSERKKLRSDCEANGIPYLRFYYDHDGWWNTRSYVVNRVAGALQ